jgi:hypothetical protein
MTFLSLYKKPAIWLFTLAAIIPSLRPLAKYLPASLFFIALFAYVFFLLVVNGALVFALERKHVPRLFHSIFPFLGIITVIFFVNLFLYPIADGQKNKGKGHGSDQDDALIETGKYLIAGKNPYHAQLYTGNHISPGPGIIILALPFTQGNRYFLFTPCVLLLTGLVLAGITRSFFYSSAFLLLLSSNCAFWETMIVGSDMIAIGLLFAMVTIALFYWKERRTNKSLFEKKKPFHSILFLATPAIILFAAMAATSRIIFIGLVPLWGFFLFKINKRDALMFSCWTTLCVLFLHGIFFGMDPAAFTPFHVIRKGNGLMGLTLSTVGALVTLLTGIFILFRTRPTLQSWIFSLTLACAAPLTFVSIGDFFWQGSHLYKWEGVNYLMMFIPLINLYFAFNYADIQKRSIVA